MSVLINKSFFILLILKTINPSKSCKSKSYRSSYIQCKVQYSYNHDKRDVSDKNVYACRIIIKELIRKRKINTE